MLTRISALMYSLLLTIGCYEFEVSEIPSHLSEVPSHLSEHNHTEFAGEYTGYIGDFNGDNHTDIYIAKKPKSILISVDPVLAIPHTKPNTNFVLVRNPDSGEFTVTFNLQGVSFSSWAEQESLEMIIGDFNIDGTKDMMVKGIGDVPEIETNAVDQIVFGSNSTNPAQVRELSSDFVTFVSDVYRWLEHPNYFEIAALQNDWFTVKNKGTSEGWWAIGYLMFWGYAAPDGTPFFEDVDDVFDSNAIPYGCSLFYSCKYENGYWWAYVTATKYEIIYDYSEFNPEAIVLAKQQHDSLQDLIDIINAKFEIEIGGGEKVLVAGDHDLDDDDPFWADLMMRIAMRDTYCVTSTDSCVVSVDDVTRVDIHIERTLQGSYTSGQCPGADPINYTSGTYTVTSSGNLDLSGFTLERGGPDADRNFCRTNAECAAIACTNTPKRIPQGAYQFTIKENLGRYPNVPELNAKRANRSGILIHYSTGAKGTVGCILVGKTSSASGVFAPGSGMTGSESSRLALAEIRDALTYLVEGERQFTYNTGTVYILNRF